MNGNDVIVLLIRPIVDTRKHKNSWFSLRRTIELLEHGAKLDWHTGLEEVLEIVKFAQLMFENQADIAHTQAAITGTSVSNEMEYREWRRGGGFEPKATYIKLEVRLPDGSDYSLTVEDSDDNLLKIMQKDDAWHERPYDLGWTKHLPD